MKRLLVLLIGILCLAAPVAAHAAYNPLSGACSAGGDASQSSGCQAPSGDPVNGSNGVLHKVANIISILGGIVAIIVIIIGGLQYVTSVGDPQKVSSARSMIIGAIVGLLIIALAQAIVIFALKNI